MNGYIFEMEENGHVHTKDLVTLLHVPLLALSPSCYLFFSVSFGTVSETLTEFYCPGTEIQRTQQCF